MQDNNQTQSTNIKRPTEDVKEQTGEQKPVSQQSSIRDTLGYVFGRVFERGQKELTKVAHESKERLLLRSLRKDRLKLYEKIGREVEQLILTGDIEHPGLEKRISKIREIEQEIEDVETRIANQHIHDEKNNET
tara:strand:- start:143 stop:544 length:402 start_codon:yes stop_codon:yes gene_type:complete